MADADLIVKGRFDPTDFQRGIAVAENSLVGFEALLNQLAKAMPDLDVARIMAEAREEVDKGVAALREMEQQAQRTRDKLREIKVPQVPPPGGPGGPNGPDLSGLFGGGIGGQADAERIASAQRLKDIFLQQGQAASRAAEGNRAWAAGAEEVRRRGDFARLIIDGMTQAGKQQITVSDRIVQGMSASARGVGLFSSAMEQGTHATTGHAAGLGKLGQQLGLIAARALEVEGPFARIAEIGLHFSAGAVGAVAVVGGLAAVAVAVRFATTAEREHEEMVQRTTRALVEQAQAAVPAVERSYRALQAATEEVDRVQTGMIGRAISGIGKWLGLALHPIDLGLAVGNEINRRDEEARANATKARAEAERQLQEAVRARIREEASSLAGLLTSGSATNQQRQQAVALEQALRAEIVAAGSDIKRRAEAQAALNALIKAEDTSGSADRQNALRSAQDRINARRQELAVEQQIREQSTALADLGFTAELTLLTRSLDAQHQARLKAAQDQKDLLRAGAELDIAGLNAQIAKIHGDMATATESEARNLRAEAAALESQIEARQKLLGLQLRQVDLGKRLADAEILARAGLGNTGGVSGVQPDSLAAEAARTLHVRTMQATEDFAELAAFVKQFNADTERFAAENAMQGLSLATEEALRLLRGAAVAVADIGNANVGPIFKTLPDEIAEIADGLGRISQSDALGELGRTAIGTATRLLDLVGALNDAASALQSIQGLSLGNVLSVGAGALGVIGSLTGQSAGERALEQALDSNVTAMDRLRASIDLSNRGAAESAQVQRALVEANREGLALNARLGTLPGSKGGALPSGRDQVEALDEQLRRLGTSFAELNAIAQQNGLQLVDSEGNLVVAAFKQLEEAIGINIDALTHLSNSFDAQRRLMDQQQQVFGIESPTSRLSQERDFILSQMNLDPATEARIQALNLTTDAGIKAFQTFIQQMFLAGKAGQLTLEQLGNIPDVNTFMQEMADAAGLSRDALDALAQQAEDTARREEEAHRQAVENFQRAISDIGERARFFNQSSLTQFNALAGQGGAGSPALSQAINGLNAANAADREELLRRLGDLLIKSQFGILSQAQTGILDPDAFQQLLLELGDTLHQIGQDQEDTARAVREQAKAARDELRRIGDLRARLTGANFDPAAQLARWISEFEQAFPNVQQAFQGFMGDVSDPAVREQVRKKLLSLLDAMAVPDSVRDEFLSMLEEGTGFLEQAAEEAKRLVEAQAELRRQAAREAELRSALAGDPQDAASRFQREIERLTSTVPDLGHFFDGINAAATDPATRRALQSALLAIFDQFSTADIEQELGITRDEFVQFLEDGANALGLFSDTVNDATKSMLNFPTAINLQALEFKAQAAEGAQLLQSNVVRTTDTATKSLLSQVAQQTTPTSTRSTVPTGAIVVEGDLIVQVNEVETDPLTLAQKVAQQAYLTNLARTGDPTVSR